MYPDQLPQMAPSSNVNEQQFYSKRCDFDRISRWSGGSKSVQFGDLKMVSVLFADVWFCWIQQAENVIMHWIDLQQRVSTKSEANGFLPENGGGESVSAPKWWSSRMSGSCVQVKVECSEIDKQSGVASAVMRILYPNCCGEKRADPGCKTLNLRFNSYLWSWVVMSSGWSQREQDCG